MRLLHLANLNSTNIGNGALIFGTERVLKEDLGDVEFTPTAWDDYTFELKKFDEKFVELVNSHDALLVNGAVTFNGREYLKNAGMRLDLPLELWSRIKKPIIFYGVSYRLWPGQPYHNLDQLKKAMSYLLNSSRVFFGVRNDGTKEWLENLLGYKSDKITEIPDPAMFVPVKDSWHLELAKDKINIIVSLNNEDEQYRFPGNSKAVFLKNLASVLERLADEREVNYILCPHYWDDYKIFSELMVFLTPRLAHQKMVSTGLMKVAHAPYFYDLYAKADLALSMRIHSMSPAIGVGTPVVPLVSQSRMTYFLNNIGLKDLAIDVFSSKLTEELYAKIVSVVELKKQIKSKFKDVVFLIRNQLMNRNKEIQRLFE